MLRPLLAHADDAPQTAALARDGGEAFVSQSLRPYLISALLDRDPERAAIVVAGDDRAARDLASGPEASLEPRSVRYYPSRGVTYESHLAPPPHLVGLRIAALDALLEPPAADAEADAQAPVIVVSAVALSEKVPERALRPHPFLLRTGELMDLDETALELVASGYERVDQVDDRGQFAIRGGLLDLFPATEDRAVRVDLFGDEIESLRWFSTFTQRSLGDAEWSRSPRRRSSPRSIGSSPRSPGSRTPTSARTSPSFCPSPTSTRCSSCIGEPRPIVAGDEDLAPALARPLAGRLAASATGTPTTCTSTPTRSCPSSTAGSGSG